MEICIQTMSGYDRTLELARWCERTGVPALAVADHYLAGPQLDSEAFDQLVILGGIARETSTLELSTLVSPLTFRHPAVHLKAAVTLDAMSDGRFTLGVGTGWMEQEHDAFGLDLPEMSERFDRLEETLAYIRAALGDEPTGFTGEYYRLGDFLPKPRPKNLRLVVGGQGAKRTPDLAGRFADEFNVFPGPAPWTERIERALGAAAGAGRDPGALLVSSAFPAMVASNGAAFDAMVARHAERRGTEPADVIAALERMSIPYGPVERAKDAFAELAGAGVTRVYLQLGGADLDGVAEAVDLARSASAGH